ncbi:MAG: Smr/MutS family protein [Hyphomicrobium sp.]
MKRPAGKGARKHLDDHEANLWTYAAQSVEPLKKRKSRVRNAADDDSDDAAPSQRTKAPPPQNPAPKAARKAAPIAPPVPPRAPASPPPIAAFDRKAERKIRSGHVEIEARVDLHGLRQDEAHATLAAFLRRCQGQGQRWVLVITGKGKPADVERDRPFEMAPSRERGVLRRSVPRWLEEPEFRALVVSYTEAALKHGGEGALYVHLRSKQRGRA